MLRYFRTVLVELGQGTSQLGLVHYYAIICVSRGITGMVIVVNLMIDMM